MGLALAVQAGQSMLGGGGGGGSSGPRLGTMYHGTPISQLPSSTKDRIYGGRGGGPFSWRQGVSQQALGEMYKHNVLPPGETGQHGRPAMTSNEAQRALSIAKNLDPIYQPDGTLRPPPAPPPAAIGAPVDVAPQAVPTDINAIQQQATNQQGLQPAGANLVNLLAQQQAARFSPNIEAIRQSFLTG